MIASFTFLLMTHSFGPIKKPIWGTHLSLLFLTHRDLGRMILVIAQEDDALSNWSMVSSTSAPKEPFVLQPCYLSVCHLCKTSISLCMGSREMSQLPI